MCLTLLHYDKIHLKTSRFLNDDSNKSFEMQVEHNPTMQMKYLLLAQRPQPGVLVKNPDPQL